MRKESSHLSLRPVGASMEECLLWRCEGERPSPEDACCGILVLRLHGAMLDQETARMPSKAVLVLWFWKVDR